MQDELRSRLELAGMAVGNLPDELESQLITAGNQLSRSLLAEKKIIALGLGDGRAMAKYFVDELIHSSQLDRPPLPCLLISDNPGGEILARELSALATHEDTLVLFQNSRNIPLSGNKDKKLSVLYEAINSINLPVILVGHSFNYHLENSNFIALTLDNESRMNYLCSGVAVSLTLAALIDHQLFGHSV
ncbi:MAG: hypothetical protein ACFHHU_09190 [Porticoccaceae bacterium]